MHVCVHHDGYDSYLFSKASHHVMPRGSSASGVGPMPVVRVVRVVHVVRVVRVVI